MRVVALDRPWTDVPTDFQDMIIHDVDDVATLRHYCTRVEVEAEASILDQIERAHAARVGKLPEKHSLAEELPRAHQAWHATQDYVDMIIEKIEHGETLPISEARPLVRACIKSISANANAMFWLARIKSEDAYTAEHCLRVGIYAITFGRYLGMTEGDLEVIGLCGMLHDIGKMKVDSAILNKPGALTDEEFAEIKRHPEYGFELLKNGDEEVEHVVLDSTLHHHERMNARGYPHGLPGHEISRFSKIVAIVDVFDAITSDRCYRAGMSTADALEVLYKGREEQFDAEMVETFIRMVGLYPPGTLVELNNGEVALVVASNSSQRLKPRVEILLNEDKAPCAPRVLDLADESAGVRIARSLPDGTYGISLAGRIEELARKNPGFKTPPSTQG
jgi:HD-GYP domain-containing protein (c-di-GMP phosphodiesterase class II)